ncbi:MAG: rod shape-determining protein RodA [Bacteroidetes bacterium]|jgi:rod shape determining protein RodA|nr:rod shape-determining protein RodA [Bacteroidota bacterium]
MKRRIDILANLDWFLVALYLLMIFIGWFNIYAAVYNDEHSRINDFTQRYGRQMVWIILAIVFAVATVLIDGQFYNFFAYAFYAFMIFLLILVLFIGKEIHGARSWFALGPIQVQPAEFAKMATCMAMAKFLGGFNVKIDKPKTILIAMGLFVIPMVLIVLQPDGGTALVFTTLLLVIYREGMPDWVIIAVFYCILLFLFPLLYNLEFVILFALMASAVAYWVMSKKTEHFAVIALISTALYFLIRLVIIPYTPISLSLTLLLLIEAGIISFTVLIIALRKRIKFVFVAFMIFWCSVGFIYSVDFLFHEFLSDYQQRRINIVLGIEEDPQGYGYNVEQSKIAIGSGGFSGKGYLEGTQTKLRFVPEQSTDFIFCTVGEEWGFLGTSVVVLLFLTFLLRLIIIAERQRIKFSRIYAYGIFAIFFIHFIVNIGMTIGLMPVIGIPLPFFSYGGSSLWAFTIMLFVLLRLDAERLTYLR